LYDVTPSNKGGGESLLKGNPYTVLEKHCFNTGLFMGVFRSTVMCLNLCIFPFRFNNKTCVYLNGLNHLIYRDPCYNKSVIGE